MSLTKDDLQQIKNVIQEVVPEIVETVVGPRFAAIDKRFDGIDSKFVAIDQQLAAIREDHERFARSVADDFHALNHRFDRLDEDNTVIKEIVKDHGFRIAKLEHRISP